MERKFAGIIERAGVGLGPTAYMPMMSYFDLNQNIKVLAIHILLLPCTNQKL